MSYVKLNLQIHVSRISARCIYADPDNLHKFNQDDSGLLAQMYLLVSKSGRKMPAQAQHLLCVYAAGPCGSWRYRYLTQKGDDCWGVAPSLRPQKPGDRVHTDRRDALQLAPLAGAGALTTVDVPKVADEARRDLTRARADAISDLQDAQRRLQAFLLRHDMR